MALREGPGLFWLPRIRWPYPSIFHAGLEEILCRQPLHRLVMTLCRPSASDIDKTCSKTLMITVAIREIIVNYIQWHLVRQLGIVRSH